MNDMLSHAVESAETQRRQYENQLRQLQSELAEHQLKAAQLEQNRQSTPTTSQQLVADEPVGFICFFCVRCL